MSDSMQQLRDEFNNRNEEEKLVMGYLVSGNSAYDLAKLLVEYIQASRTGWAELVDEIKAYMKDSELGYEECKAQYTNAYKALGESINKPVIG